MASSSGWTPPPRPPWVEKLNAMAIGLGGTDRLVPLDEASLLEAAGETIDGLGPWAEAFRAVVAGAVDEGDLHPAGALITRNEIVQCLQNRRGVEAAHAADPALAASPIEAPVIITGLARSGTSILHELLAQDPAHRVPLAWEVFFSIPPPDTGTYTTDARIALADQQFTFWNEVAPEYRAMHDNRGDLPVEDIFATAQVFTSDEWAGAFPSASYRRWLYRQDQRGPLAYHRRLLQVLQSRHRGDRWVTKAPSHLGYLPALFDVYPDAWVVITHRDPLKSVPSSISLMATLHWMRSNHTLVDKQAPRLGRDYAAMLGHMVALRSTGEVPDDRIIDLRYADVQRDPVAALRVVYDRIGAEFTPAAQERVRAYLAGKPKGKHGAHDYTLEEFGLDRRELRAGFADYQQAFAVPDED